jgi:hypothetical protein
LVDDGSFIASRIYAEQEPVHRGIPEIWHQYIEMLVELDQKLFHYDVFGREAVSFQVESVSWRLCSGADSLRAMA